MPKNVKRKRAAPAAPPKDFTKQKKKVGKKANANPTNTVTDFKAKSIVLPDQSILQDKQGAVVNKRNLSLRELLTQCSHYNANVRKEAVLGIKDLFALHPQTLSSSLAPLFDKIFELISDEDIYVRQAIRTLFEFLLPLIPARLMQPHMKLFVIYLINGMTNINLDIRLSALELIKQVIIHLPEYLPTFYLELLPNFLDLLASVGFGTRGGILPKDTSKRTGYQKHLPILKSLYHLLKSVQAFRNAQAHEGKKTTSTSTPPAYLWDWEEYKSHWPHAHARFFMTKQLFLGPSESKSITTQNQSESEILADFSKKLIPALLKRWLECSPSDPFTSTTNLESMALVLDIIHILFVLNDKANKSKEDDSSVLFGGFLEDFKKYLMPHFPISEPINKSVEDKKAKEGASARLTVSRLNSTLCAIMAYFVEPTSIEDMNEESTPKQISFAAPTTTKSVLPAFLQSRSEKMKEVNDAVDAIAEGKRPDKWMTSVYRHVVRKLQDKETAGNKSMVQEVALLLTVVQKLLPALPAPLQNELMQAFHSFYLACHIMSQAKRKCIKWIVELLSAPASQHGGWSPDAAMTQQWILSFPQILWKLQDKNPGTTQLILSTLIGLINRPPHTSQVVQANLQSLKDHLVPFFFTQVPASKTRKAAKLYGPFIRLPEPLQRLSLQLIFHFDELSPKLLKALTACSRYLSLALLRYMSEILYHCYAKGTLPLFELSSTILSLLVANSVNRKAKQAGEDDEEEEEEDQEEQEKEIKKKRTSEKQEPSSRQRKSAAAQPSKKGKEKESDMEVVVIDQEEEHATTDNADKDYTSEEERKRTHAEQRAVVEILTSNVRLWGVQEALESMQTMLLLLLTTEAADVHTKEALLVFVSMCSCTRRSYQTSEQSSPWMGLPPALAKEMPQVMFHLLSAEAERNVGKAHLHEAVVDILTTDATVLPSYLAHLNEELSQKRDQVLHLVLALVTERRLQALLVSNTIRSQILALASVLLQGDDLTPTQHKLQVEVQLLYGAF